MDVKRYWPIGTYETERAEMDEAADGGYVDHDDYSAVEADRALLAARVAELERERDFLKERERDICAALGGVPDGGQYREDILARIRSLSATLAQHREALKPLAAFADALHPAVSGNREDRDPLLTKESTIDGEIVSRTITYGDCRRARSVWEAGSLPPASRGEGARG